MESLARSAWEGLKLQERARLMAQLARRVHQGQPREFAETFFMVENKLPGGAAVVQARLVANQDHYYRECFEGREKARSPLYAVGDKARQAYHSVFWLLMGLAQYYTLPGGWNIALFAHYDKTLKTFGSYIDTMRSGIPLDMRPKESHWRDDYKELEFVPGVVNRIDFFSAESNTVPRGARYQMVLYSEGAFYRESYWDKVSTAMRGLQPIWEVWDSTRNGTTYPETGNANQHFVKVQALEEGARKGFLLRRFWYHDAANAIAPHHPLALPGTEGDFAWTEEETALAREFPEDGIPPMDRMRWRRTEIAAYIEQQGGNTKRGKAKFLQENLENAANWANAEKTPFDVELAQRYLDIKQIPHHRRNLANGLLEEFAHGPMPGHDYAAGQDCASGKRDGDLDSISLVDALDGNTRLHVGRIIGRAGSEETAVAAMPHLRAYGNAYWAIEVNAGWGHNAVKAAKAAYPKDRIYRRQKDRNETPEHYHQHSDYGFLTTAASKDRVITALIDDFNTGRFKTFFPATLHTLMNYDPKGSVHTPDEIISLAIANEAAKDRRVWTQHDGPTPGPTMRHQTRQGWTRRPARPFALR